MYTDVLVFDRRTAESDVIRTVFPADVRQKATGICFPETKPLKATTTSFLWQRIDFVIVVVIVVVVTDDVGINASFGCQLKTNNQM